MKVLIVGCGYVGSHLAEELKKLGHEVWALRRGAPSLKELESLNIQPFQADITRLATLEALPETDVIVFTQAPKNAADTYRNVYYQGTKNILKIAECKKTKKVIFISSTSVYSAKDGAWVDEKTELFKDEYESPETEANAKCLIDAEKLVLGGKIPSVVLRLGGIYGPGRHRLKALREGTMKPSFGENYINRVHVQDIVSAILLLMEKGAPGEIYLGVDDTPSTQKEFYSWLCQKLNLNVLGLKKNPQNLMHGSNKRCSNKKIKALGFEPKYPSFKEGYEPLLKEAVL